DSLHRFALSFLRDIEGKVPTSGYVAETDALFFHSSELKLRRRSWSGSRSRRRPRYRSGGSKYHLGLGLIELAVESKDGTRTGRHDSLEFVQLCVFPANAIVQAEINERDRLSWFESHQRTVV